MNAVVVMMFVMTLIVGALLVVTPWLMPKTECFAVTVPHGARSQEPLVGFMRSYAKSMVVVVVLCLLVWPLVLGFVSIDLTTERGMGAFAGLVSGTMCVPVLVSFALMLYYRRRVQEVKRDRGWSADGASAAAVVGPEEFPKPISIAWNLAYVPIIAGMAAFALIMYDKFPDMIPMRIDFNGTVTDSVAKSTATVMFPVMLTAFLGLVFTGCHWGIVHSKKPVDASVPASSALAYGRFARMQSLVLFTGGIGMSVASGVAFFASTLGFIDLTAAVIIITVVALVFAAAMLAASVGLGQSGSRVTASAGDGGMPRDDDRFWPLGIFYFNRHDPSIFVPKRFGIGWTLNLGRWETWFVLVVFALLITGFALLTTMAAL